MANNNNKIPNNNNNNNNNNNEMPIKNGYQMNLKQKQDILTHAKRFIKKFFKNIDDNDNYYILKKEVDLEQLKGKLRELREKFRKKLQIPLRIDPRILLLCKSCKDSNERTNKYLKEYFTNNRLGYESTYNSVNILIPDNDILNSKKFLNNSNLTKNIFLKYSKAKKNYTLRQSRQSRQILMSEIRLRRFAIECGFETWEQLKNMVRLFKYIYKNKLNKYFDFNSVININTNESNANNNRNFNISNSNEFNNEIFRGLNLHRGAQKHAFKQRIRNVRRYHNPNYSSSNEINVNNGFNTNNIRPYISNISQYMLTNSNNNNN